MYKVLGYACLILELLLIICLKRNILGVKTTLTLGLMFGIVSFICFVLGGKNID